jgi:hypothetical protein
MRGGLMKGVTGKGQNKDTQRKPFRKQMHSSREKMMGLEQDGKCRR